MIQRKMVESVKLLSVLVFLKEAESCTERIAGGSKEINLVMMTNRQLIGTCFHSALGGQRSREVQRRYYKIPGICFKTGGEGEAHLLRTTVNQDLPCDLDLTTH